MTDHAVEFCVAEHFKAIGIGDGWSWKQVEQLAIRLKCRPAHLVIAAGGTVAQVKTWKRSNKVPVIMSLHLYNFNSWARAQEGKPSLPAIPIHLIL